MIKTSKDFWRLYPEQFSDLGEYPNMTDKHSSEVVARRIAAKVLSMFCDWPAPMEILKQLEPGDLLPGGNVVEQDWKRLEDHSNGGIRKGFVFVPAIGIIRVKWKHRGSVGTGWYSTGYDERIYGATHIRPLMEPPHDR